MCHARASSLASSRSGGSVWSKVSNKDFQRDNLSRLPHLSFQYTQPLHRLHISPTGQRFLRAWNVDVPPGALSAALEALTIACQLIRVFDCGRAPCKGDGGNQPNQQGARAYSIGSLRRLESEDGRYFDPRAAFRSRESTSRVGSSLEFGPAVRLRVMVNRSPQARHGHRHPRAKLLLLGYWLLRGRRRPSERSVP